MALIGSVCVVSFLGMFHITIYCGFNIPKSERNIIRVGGRDIVITVGTLTFWLKVPTVSKTQKPRFAPARPYFYVLL